MLTEFTITIITEQDAEQAENEIREAIAKAGYDISDFITQEVECPKCDGYKVLRDQYKAEF
jgi:hypothetical protein